MAATAQAMLYVGSVPWAFCTPPTRVPSTVPALAAAAAPELTPPKEPRGRALAERRRLERRKRRREAHAHEKPVPGLSIIETLAVKEPTVHRPAMCTRTSSLAISSSFSG